MQNDATEIVLYQADDGTTTLEVQLTEGTVWLSQAQMVDLFDATKQNISLHINNIFREGELLKNAVVKESLTTASDGKKYKINYYNLDVIISVGYRVKSIRGTQFRIWATSVLRDHLIKGYTVNKHRLAEKGLLEMEQTVALLSKTLQNRELVTDEGKAVLSIISRYAKTWMILLHYDEERLGLPKKKTPIKHTLSYWQAQKAISRLKNELMVREEASSLFGQERANHLKGILGNIDQTFGGEDLYLSVEEKAAHLLYFVIKDHPFTDGNKRIGAFLFLLYLRGHGLLQSSGINENGLVALALLIAESDPEQKELMVRLIMNLLSP